MEHLTVGSIHESTGTAPFEPTTAQKPRVALLATARIAPGFFRIFFVFLSRKKVVAAASRRERACKRTGEPSVPFCEEEE